MFDARSILDALIRGGGGRDPSASGPATGGEVFKDLLGQLGQQGREPPMQEPPPSDQRQWPQSDPALPSRRSADPGDGQPPAPGARTSGDSLEDLLRSVLGGGAATGGGLQDMLRDMLGGQPGQVARAFGIQSQGPGELLDVLKQVLGQATSGVREGAGKLDDMTGASGRAREAVGQATGQSPEELIAKVKELIANNRLGAGAALGGLGALILGTGAGRSLAGSAIKLGGLALIGGLAYKAYQNYQQGLPPLTGAQPGSQPQALAAAPRGSGFDTDAVTHDHAVLYIRAMIAAAAADGRIDASEREKILGGLQQAGLSEEAQQFLASEIGNPASAEELAAGVASEQDAIQVYTAARIAIDADTGAEHAFLARLANALGIDAALAAQVDAAAQGAA